MKRAIKDWLRTAIQQRAASGSPVATVLLGGLERAGRWPGIGPSCSRWAGLIHATQGRQRHAVAAYQAAIDGGLIGHPSLHYDLGKSLLETGDARLAETAFRTAMKLAPSAPWPVYGVIQALEEQCRVADIVPELLAAAQHLSPEHVQHLPFPKYLAPQVEKKEDQITALRELVRNHPDAAFAAILLAQVETLRGNVPAAEALFRSAGKVLFRNRQDVSAPVAAPTFLIIGQAKAGTSALFQYLSSHPSIVPPVLKEPQYWSKYRDLGPDWYASLFPRLPEGSGLITGEGSTTYLNDPDTPARIRHELPRVKLIVLLREPVARAYSEYWMHVRLGLQAASFEEAISAEMAEMPACPLDDHAMGHARSPLPYLGSSAVLPHLKRWLCHFPPEQLLIVRNARLASDLPGVMHRVCRFIGVSPFLPHEPRRHNEGRYPPMSPDVKEKLRDWFAPHERALEEFLDSLPEARP